MKPQELEIPKDKDYALRSQTPEEIEKNYNREIPEYQIKLKLAEKAKKTLEEQVFMEFEALKQERADLKLESKWKERDNQYDGKLAANDTLEFNFDVRESKVKVDAITRAIMEAMFPDGDQVIDVTPRPETARKDGFEVAQRQSQFLDYAIDEEIKPFEDYTKIARSSVMKFVGIGKLVWSYKQETRRREECYLGKYSIIDYDGNGQPITDHEGLRAFLSSYPDAMERYTGYVQRLLDGKDVNIVAKYKEAVDNNPEIKYIKVEDFYVSNKTKGNKGLRTAHCIVERMPYSYWELKDLEKSGEFENVDAVFFDKQSDANGEVSDDIKTAHYDIIEVTTYFKVNDSDKEETKIKCWFGEKNKCLLSVELYPYYAIDCEYIGHYVTTNDKGFYGDAESVMYDLRDTHLSTNALLNILLQGLLYRNTVTPITTEGSEVEQMFIDHKFRSGQPIVLDEFTDDVRKGIDFVQFPVMDMNGGLAMAEKMRRIGSDVTRVSDLTTGGESKLDPDAPASKTIALLQQSGMGIKDYIKHFVQSFNIFATNLLQLYYQMSTEDRMYRIRQKSKQVTGKDIFSSIRRDELIVKTNVQSRAAGFAFDKVSEKNEASVAYQIVKNDTYAMQLPQMQYKALKVLLKTFGSQWKTISDVDLPGPEEFDAQMMNVAVQAVQKLMQAAQQQAQVTGVAPDPKKVFASAPEAIKKAQMVAMNPQLAEEAE